MKDEEMIVIEIAEEYAKLNARQYIQNDGIGFCTSEEEVKQAYLAGLKAGRPKWHEVADGYILSKNILGLWEATVCEIRSEIKSWDLKGPHTADYAKELCDKLEYSMCAVAGGNYSMRYTIE